MWFVLIFKGLLWWQEPEAAGHRTSAGRKERLKLRVQFSFLFSPRLRSMRMVLLTSSVGLPTSLNLVYIVLHRRAQKLVTMVT